MLIFVPIPPIFHPTESIYNIFKHSRLLVTPELGPRGAKWAPKSPKMGKITIFPKLKGLECSFLFLSPIFHPTESIYNSFKHSRLLVTPELGLRGAKWAPKPPKMGKIAIFPKLEGLEC